jgi:hypothetical protein
MSNRKKLALGLALVGFLLPAAIYIYADITDYVPNPVSGMLIVLCHPCVAGSYLFFDVNGHSLANLCVMSFLAITNSAVYFGLGALIGRWLPRKSI